MSGGVDSSVTARLLAEKDYDLKAVFMRNWDTRDEKASDTGCEWERDWEDVQRVCRQLGIPHEMVDLSQQYWTRVFEPALDVWSDGATPNPDVSCNREIKFGAFVDKVLSSPDTQWLATGHYARIGWDQSVLPLRPKLMRAVDSNKDQSYYLSSVKEDKLKMTLFPIGHLTKPQVRDLAKKYDLPTAARSESMGICFVGERGRFERFLSQYIPPSPGNLVDLEGNVLGRHTGLYNYTIGQNARLGGQKEKLFVARKDKITKDVVLVNSSTHPALMCTSLTLKNWQWIWSDHDPPLVDSDSGLPVTAQIRHRMQGAPGWLKRISADTFELRFADPAHAATPGQIATVWDRDWCLGCGTIEDTVCLA